MKHRATWALCAAGWLVVIGQALADDGSAVFARNCQLCHQTGAVGLAGAFPRLAGRLSVISTKPVGRSYLIDVLTYGMAGSITVDKQPLIGVMPSFAQLSVDDVAAVLSYLQTLGDQSKSPPTPFTPKEVAIGRAQPAKTAADVIAERQTLEKAKVIP
jgi:mono/diheme cytochrome c family protein